MKRKRNNDEVREQSSIFYHSPEPIAAKSLQVFGGLYTQMFYEDLSRALLPIWGNRRGSTVSLNLKPENSDMENVICEALDLSRSGYGYRNLDSALGEFLRLTMVELCFSRQAMFEIVYLRSGPTGARCGFDLVHINPRQLISSRNQWYQLVPPDIARARNVAEKISLPLEKIATISLPPSLNRIISKTLAALSKLNMQESYELTAEAQTNKFPYNFSEHNQSMNLALLEATRDSGWMGRGIINDKVTNYYRLRQDIRFKIFALQIRNALISELNILLNRVGKPLGWSTNISISGLPTTSDYEQVLAQLEAGDKSFVDIVNHARKLENPQEQA